MPQHKNIQSRWQEKMGKVCLKDSWQSFFSKEFITKAPNDHRDVHQNIVSIIGPKRKALSFKFLVRLAGNAGNNITKHIGCLHYLAGSDHYCITTEHRPAPTMWTRPTCLTQPFQAFPCFLSNSNSVNHNAHDRPASRVFLQWINQSNAIPSTRLCMLRATVFIILKF